MNSQALHSATGFDRDRDIEERQRAHPQPEDVTQRDREQAERQHRDQYQSGGLHHSSAGSIPIHQPVASRVAGAIHSPGGLLASHGSSAPSIPLGAPSGSVVNFGPPLVEPGARPAPHTQGTANSQHQMFAPIHHGGAPPPANTHGAHGGPPPNYPGPLPPQESQRPLSQSQYGAPMPSAHPGPAGPPGSEGPGGLTQGQQPILNDALTYLDQVKVQFHDQPDVYNRFLDIMKDFKSQSIDTPGVINRVSELFAGHPNLIQGFNTFLPPGYRIECGAGNDPNTIRVTTPMGTTVQSIAGRGTQVEGHPQGSANQQFFTRGTASWQPQPQHSIESPEANFSTVPQPGVPGYIPGQPQGSHVESSTNGPQQQQRTPQIQNASVGNGPSVRNAHTPTPTGAQGPVNGSAPQPGSNEKRGPVEFNHAISYVNKIKNRFQDKPEIYKQFLEILQTYQRESKAITEVYAQVTALFHSAPDLLEDFKQFLPETAGQAKVTPSRTAEEGPAPPGPVHTPQSVMSGQKMPPLGSFAPPPSATKESKKRSRTDKPPITQAPVPAEPLAPTNRATPGATINNANKRTKLVHKPLAMDTPLIEPTLTPVVPEPMSPPSSAKANQEELAFFDKVKKYLGNRAAMSEFLKLCNLFSQQIIDRATLYHKGATFLAANPDLLSFWKKFLSYEPQDSAVDNRPPPPTDKVSLSNCRGYGPSYRLLPKRERLKPCSGRDELCNSVLNDDWASHPTWASEDSGFVAHRKNAFEEGLHRIEEERHDYDFNIEANLKCIQLLEPIAQQMLVMTPSEQEQFRMPAALAGQTTSIFKRVCKKVYGERGIDVVNDMFSTPFTVVPVVLARLKQKDEEWRFSQREWEKVWHNQTESMHLKSLDHMGILVKQNDKRNLSAKHLVDVIKTKHEEQRRERTLKGIAPRHQFHWTFSDKDVTVDLLRIMMLYAFHNGQHSAHEKERIMEFFETFIPQFFDLEDYHERLPKFQMDSGDEDADEAIPAELTNGRSRRNGKKSDLLRGVLDPGRNGSKSRNQKEDSTSGSKETTPDVGSVHEEEMPDASDEQAAPDVSNERWMPTIPRPTIINAAENDLLTADNELKADGYFPRPWYNFFCNQTLFVFFSVFEVLYHRLKEVKESRQSVSESIARLTRPRPARDIGFTENTMTYFDPSDDPATFWPKTRELIEDYITGEIDENRYQDVLRHYYLGTGWKIYTIQDLIKTLCRLSLTCTSSDSKEKTPDLLHQFLASREKEETSYQTEISARKFAEKCVKEGDIFVICWLPHSSEANVRWLQREETTFYMDEMKLQQRWQYYISSYIRVEPTEGVPRSKLSKVVLTRNLPSLDTDPEEDSIPKPASYDENLVVSICLRTSKMIWGAGSSEYFVYEMGPNSKEQLAQHDSLVKSSANVRESRLRERFVMNNNWMKDLSQEEVEKANTNYQKWAAEGILAHPTDEMDIAE